MRKMILQKLAWRFIFSLILFSFFIQLASSQDADFPVPVYPDAVPTECTAAYSNSPGPNWKSNINQEGNEEKTGWFLLSVDKDLTPENVNLIDDWYKNELSKDGYSFIKADDSYSDYNIRLQVKELFFYKKEENKFITLSIRISDCVGGTGGGDFDKSDCEGKMKNDYEKRDGTGYKAYFSQDSGENHCIVSKFRPFIELLYGETIFSSVKTTTTTQKNNLDLSVKFKPDSEIYYNLRGREPDLNSIDDPVVSPYDDLLCTASIKIQGAESGDNIDVDFLISSEGNVIQKEHITHIHWQAFSNSGNIHCDEQGKGEIYCYFRLDYEKLTRGQDLKCDVTANFDGITKSETSKTLTVAKHLYIYVPSSFSGTIKQYKEGNLWQHEQYQTMSGLGKYAKIIMRFDPETDCGKLKNHDVHTCTRYFYKEDWNPELDRILAVNNIKKGVAPGGPNSDWVIIDSTKDIFKGGVAHEIGHTYGLCEEYVYGVQLKVEWPPIEYGGWKLEDILFRMETGQGCRNSYPSCCNDAPDNSGNTNACYNKRNCEFTVGEKKYNTENLILGCAGNYYGGNKWSVMGALTSPAARKCIQGEVNQVYPVPVPG